MTEVVLALTLAGDLAMAYPGRTVTEDHARSWAREFQAETEPVARRAASLLRNRSLDPPSVAQVRQAIHEARGDTMSPDVPYRTTGPALEPGVLSHGIYHLRRVWAGHEDEREAMRKPWACKCEKATG